MSPDTPPLPPDLLPSVPVAGYGESDRFRDEFRHEGDIPSWDTATRFFNTLIQKFEQEPYSHRALDIDCFTSTWAGAKWRDLYLTDRKACEWAEQTVLITFTGRFYSEDEERDFYPPITYLSLLQQSSSARQQMLSRILDDVSQWRSIRVVGHLAGRTCSAYPVMYLGLYLSSHIDKKDLSPLLETHVANCPIAKSESHFPTESVSVKSDPTHKSELIHGLGRRVPGLKSNKGITVESWDRRALATVLHTGNWRCCRFGRSI